ncbi:MAG: AraC family transcriptional regulator ligand-binding domain-containing protein [Gammaproteobacteria bacterium]
MIDTHAQPDAIRQAMMPADYVWHLSRRVTTPARIVSGTTIALDELERPDRYITVEQNLRCVANAMRLMQSPSWYLAWGAHMGEHMHGPLTPAMLTAPTLGDALDAFVNYFVYRIPYMSLRSRTEHGWFEIELIPRLPVGELLPLLVEIPLLILQRYVNVVRGRPMEDARITLAYPAHRGAGETRRWFDCELGFEAGRNAFCIPVAWRQWRNPGFNAQIWRASLAQCAECAQARARSPDQEVRVRLYEAFADADATGSVPTLEALACELHMSPRTLIRRLRTAGTSYQAELDAARRERAFELLARATLPVTAVAYTLGYADSASFAKAFRRWTGQTPGAYRRSAHDAASIQARSPRRSG